MSAKRAIQIHFRDPTSATMQAYVGLRIRLATIRRVSADGNMKAAVRTIRRTATRCPERRISSKPILLNRLFPARFSKRRTSYVTSTYYRRFSSCSDDSRNHRPREIPRFRDSLAPRVARSIPFLSHVFITLLVPLVYLCFFLRYFT